MPLLLAQERLPYNHPRSHPLLFVLCRLGCVLGGDFEATVLYGFRSVEEETGFAEERFSRVLERSVLPLFVTALRDEHILGSWGSAVASLCS